MAVVNIMTVAAVYLEAAQTVSGSFFFFAAVAVAAVAAEEVVVAAAAAEPYKFSGSAPSSRGGISFIWLKFCVQTH